MKKFMAFLLIFIAVVTLAVFLYSFSYNLALGQTTDNTTTAEDKAFSDALKKAVDEQFAERRNMNMPAPSSKLFDWEADDLTPFPSEGQILIDISAWSHNYDYAIGWSGSMRVGILHHLMVLVEMLY